MRDLDNPKDDRLYLQIALKPGAAHREPLLTISVGGYANDPRDLTEIQDLGDFVDKWLYAARTLKKVPAPRDALLALGVDPTLDVEFVPLMKH